MYLRLASILAVLLTLAVLTLTESVRMTPYWQAQREMSASSRPALKFQPLNSGHVTLKLGWASFPDSYLNALPVGIPDVYEKEDSYYDIHEEVALDTERFHVSGNLPEGKTYAAKLSNKEDALVLPLSKQPDGTYTTSRFIPLVGYDRTSKYFYGVRVFHIDRGNYSLQVGTLEKP